MDPGRVTQAHLRYKFLVDVSSVHTKVREHVMDRLHNHKPSRFCQYQKASLRGTDMTLAVPSAPKEQDIVELMSVLTTVMTHLKRRLQIRGLVKVFMESCSAEGYSCQPLLVLKERLGWSKTRAELGMGKIRQLQTKNRNRCRKQGSGNENLRMCSFGLLCQY